MSDANPPARPTRSLVSPQWDFWLIGGASLVVWLLMQVGARNRALYGVKNHFAELALTMGFVSILVNYPHFLASYKLAYGRGLSFLRKHWFQTIMVPCLLVNFLVYAYYLANMPGAKTQCEWMLGAAVNFMYFTVGWHYTKQAFGCTMVYASYERYPLNSVQRESIRWSLLSIWWYSFVYNGLQGEGTFWGLRYRTWILPPGSLTLTGWLFTALTVWTAYVVLWRNWKVGARPSPTLLAPYLAMLVWFTPGLRQTDYFLYMVPFFHSLQYLAFVYRVERSTAGESAWQLGLVASALLVSGWLSFEVVPGNLDESFDNMRTFGFSFFLIAANLFINIHHYFLDNVLWRVREDERVRAALFS